MGASDQEGWRALAAYLHALREARWAGLPPEATAEETWPHFKAAVVAAMREDRSPVARPPQGRDERRPDPPPLDAGSGAMDVPDILERH